MVSNHYCSVPQCKSWAKRNLSVHFHKFPQENKRKVYMKNASGQKELIDRRQAWIQVLKIGKPVTNFMKVCSLHFVDEDYFYKGKFNKIILYISCIL